MTTTRERFTNKDVQIGFEWGIEFGTHKGSMRVLDYQTYGFVCEFNDDESYLFLNVKELNQFIKGIRG